MDILIFLFGGIGMGIVIIAGYFVSKKAVKNAIEELKKEGKL